MWTSILYGWRDVKNYRNANSETINDYHTCSYTFYVCTIVGYEQYSYMYCTGRVGLQSCYFHHTLRKLQLCGGGLIMIGAYEPPEGWGLVAHTLLIMVPQYPYTKGLLK